MAGFFVLSGFLITTLLLKEEARHGRVCYPSFLVRRMLRIWPAYFMCLVVLNGVVGFSTLEYRALVSDMTFTRTFLGRDLFTDNGGHLWSIAVEEQFYFVWPVAFIFLKNIYVRATFLCAGLLYLSVYRGYISDRFIPILVGCLFGVIYHKIRSGVVQRYLPLLRLPALLGFMYLAVGSHEGMFHVFPSMVCGVLVVSFLGEMQNLRLRAICSIGGKWTFSFYLFHQAVLGITRKMPMVQGMGAFARIGVSFCLALVVAAVVYTFVERPLLRLKSDAQSSFFMRQIALILPLFLFLCGALAHRFYF